MLVWLIPVLTAIVTFVFRDEVKWLTAWPKAYIVPFGRWIDQLMGWFATTFSNMFDMVAWLLSQPLLGLQIMFAWLPWPVTIGAIALIALYGGGGRLAIFALFSLTYVAVVGYWTPAMFTLSLVTVAVPIAVLIGLVLGVLAFSFRPVRQVVEPALDVMQAMPAFAYLVPMLMLFGLSPMVAISTSAIYAIPPMTRSVMLGFSRVPTEVIESAVMSGSTNRQILWWVRFPMSLPTLLLGLNQTIMATFALVVFAAIVGGSLDIGYEVLLRLRKSQFGESFLAGIVITLFAILADRISRGFAERRSSRVGHGRSGAGYKTQLWLAMVLAVVVMVLAEFMPVLRSYPEAWVFYPADVLNDAVRGFTASYYDTIEKFKTSVLFFFLLPLRSGMENSVRPHVWGFELTPLLSALYAVAIASLAALAGWRWSWRSAVAIALLGGLYYFGTTGTPWPAFIAVITLLAWQVGGWRIGLFSFAALAFVLLTGYWQAAMMSVYLCGAAVLVCFVLGGALGIAAALSDRVSAVIRPINDTLQSIPLFVFLIPVVMVALHGDFSAFLAIIMYAIVPAIRYTEHGIRNVPREIIEAARSFGTTRRQMLFHVELPLALPEIMLGLNQIVVFALAMLIVTALLGTQDLGQKIYEALTRGQPGQGLVAGLGIAFIAMISDRILQSWARRRKQALGLT